MKTFRQGVEFLTERAFKIPRDATAEDLRTALAHWESGGGGCTGYYVEALYRYWKREGPSFSESGLRDYEYVRRLLEGH